MKALIKANRSFRLEALETRTLLAADAGDPFGLVADFNLAMHAVSGTGDFQATFSIPFGNHQLVLTGSSTASLTIDLSQLPSFVTNLKISSFGDVHFVGSDHLDNLILTSIGSVAAPNLAVTQATFASDVASLSVASLGANAVLSGTDMKLTAISLDGTTIFSDLHSLTLTSDSKVLQFIALPGAGQTSNQTLNLTYTPDVTAISGIPTSAVHVVLPQVDTIPTTPTDNSNPADTTGSSPSIPASDSGQLVIVSLPLDEHTRALVAQLSDLLHSSQDDSQQQVLDLLNHATLPVAHSVTSLPAEGLAGYDPFGPSALVPWSHGGIDLSNLAVSQSEGKAIDPVAHGFASTATQFVSGSPEPVAAPLPDGLVVSGVVDVDVTWPLALTISETDVSAASAARKAVESEISPVSVADSVRALGNYIVQRFSAEFSPGQQSLVLLVDPQPTRAANANRKSTAERLATGEATVIPGATTVAA